MFTRTGLLGILLVLLCTEALTAPTVQQSRGMRPSGAAPRGTKKQSSAYIKMELECKMNCKKQGDPNTDESPCVTKCIDANCHQTFWVEYELEEGEVDTRMTKFRQCVYETVEKSADKRQTSVNSATESRISIKLLALQIGITGCLLFIADQLY